MSAELATIDGEIIEHRAPMTLFGTDNPEAVVERASAVATALGAVINERKLFAQISGKKHVQVEGWTLLGSMLGVFAEIEWSRPLENGWEARAVARTLNGNVVGAAEAMCTANEGKWRNADTYAVRSMAQTRAVSKALRMPLGFIMHLAGYSATPAEEIPDEQPSEGERAQAQRAASRPATTPPTAQRTPEERALLDELLAIPGMTTARLSLLADAVGVEKGTRANEEQLREMLARTTIESTPSPERVPTHPDEAAAGSSAPSPSTTPGSETVISDPATVPDSGTGLVPPSPPESAPSPDELIRSAAEAVGGEVIEVPPAPGTDAYKALPAAQKAAARAYHSKPPEQETLAAALGAELAE